MHSMSECSTIGYSNGALMPTRLLMIFGAWQLMLSQDSTRLAKNEMMRTRSSKL